MIKKGMKVKIISGKDRGKDGEVIDDFKIVKNKNNIHLTLFEVSFAYNNVSAVYREFLYEISPYFFEVIIVVRKVLIGINSMNFKIDRTRIKTGIMSEFY